MNGKFFKSNGIKQFKKIKWDTLISYIVLILLITIMGILKPKTISLYYLGIKSDMVLPLVFLSMGQTLVLISGGIDLSVGGVMSLSTCIMATGIGNIWTTAILVIIIGAVVGLLNGVLIAQFKLQPFIATMATWTTIGGFALWLLKTDGGFIPEYFRNIFVLRIAGLPITLIIIAVILILWQLFKNTPFGYSIYAIGSNQKAAYFNGIKVKKTKIIVYMISGLMAALSGITYSAITGTGSPTVGNSNIMMSVAAAVIGGTSLSGGVGGMAGTIVGVFILKIISDVLVFAGVTSYWTPLLQGILLIVSVAIGSISTLIKKKRSLSYD